MSIGTAEAYEAYLQAFPTGMYAALARLRLAGRSVPAQSGPNLQTPSKPQDLQPGKLVAFSAPAESGSVSFQIGDRFYGPGVITVGRFGGRKQVLIPNGEWVALAAFDHASAHTNPAPMATVVFGQFEATQMRSVIAATFNRAGGQVRDPAWTDFELCLAGNPANKYLDKVKALTFKSCANVRSWDGLAPFSKSSTALRIKPVVEALGSLVPDLQVSTEFIVTGPGMEFMSYRRADCVLPAAGGEPCPNLSLLVLAGQGFEQALASRVEWAKAASKYLLDGFKRVLDVEDLEPNKNKTARAFTLLQ